MAYDIFGLYQEEFQLRILAIPKNTDKKYSFELFELLRYYQNEVTSFEDKNSIPSVKIFSAFKKLKDPFGFKNETVSKNLDKILNKEKFDFFWNLGLNREYLHLLAQRSAHRKIRFVQTISDDALIFPDNWTNSKQASYGLDKLVKFYDSSIDLFLVHSKFIKNILKQNGIDEEKIVHISAFVDSSKYNPCFKSENYCIYRYREEDRQGIDFLIDTMKKIPKHKLIITAPKNDFYIKNIKKKCNLQNVLFLENLSETEKQNLFKMARFPIVFSDTYPQEILENYAIGKPVLAVHSGSNEEYVVNAYSGLLFNIDIDDLSGKIDYLMQSPDFCSEAGKFARSLARNCFDKQNHYNRIFNAIHTIPQKELLRTFNNEYLNIS